MPSSASKPTLSAPNQHLHQCTKKQDKIWARNINHPRSWGAAATAMKREAAPLAARTHHLCFQPLHFHTGPTPSPAWNNSSCVCDCSTAATSLLIKISPSLDNIITECQNLPIRTQGWKLPREKVEWRIVFIHDNAAPAWCSRGVAQQTWQCFFKGICQEKTMF